MYQGQTRELVILRWILGAGETNGYVVEADHDQIGVIDLKCFAGAGYDPDRNEWLLTHHYQPE